MFGMTNQKIQIISSTAGDANNFFINAYKSGLQQKLLNTFTKIAQATISGPNLQNVYTNTNAFPQVVPAHAQTIASNMVPVQPMSPPTGIMPWFDFPYEDDWDDEMAAHNEMNV
jgi:hypothetical protein